MFLSNLQSVALPVPEIIGIAVLGWLRTPNLGKGRPKGIRDGTVRKSVGEFLWALHSNFSSIFTRFRDIAVYVVLHATFPHPI